MSIDFSEFGVTQSRDLNPNGLTVIVTTLNKAEYAKITEITDQDDKDSKRLSSAYTCYGIFSSLYNTLL